MCPLKANDSFKEQCQQIFRLQFVLGQTTSSGPNRHAQNDFKFLKIFIELFLFVIDSLSMNTPGSQ
jgi:hypothetical protein